MPRPPERSFPPKYIYCCEPENPLLTGYIAYFLWGFIFHSSISLLHSCKCWYEQIFEDTKTPFTVAIWNITFFFFLPFVWFGLAGSWRGGALQLGLYCRPLCKRRHSAAYKCLNCLLLDLKPPQSRRRNTAKHKHILCHQPHKSVLVVHARLRAWVCIRNSVFQTSVTVSQSVTSLCVCNPPPRSCMKQHSHWLSICILTAQ